MDIGTGAAWRKWLVAAIPMVILLVHLAASAATITLNYYKWGDDVQAESRAAEVFMRKYPHIDVLLVTTPQASYFDKILTMYAAGSTPDVFALNAQNVARFYKQGVVAPLTQFMRRDGFDPNAYLPGSWTYSLYEGEYYGMPRSTMGSAFAAQLYAYNHSLFNQAGLAHPRLGWTFAEFLQAAKSLTRDTDGDGEPDQWGTNPPNLAWWWIWVWSNGGELLDESATKLLIDRPEAIGGLDWAGALVGQHRVAGSGDFTANQVAMKLEATSSSVRQYASLPDLEWGFAQIPAGPNGDGGYSRGGCNVVVMSSQTKSPAEAWLFLQFLVSRENQVREVLEEKTGNPVLRSIANTADYLRPKGPPYDMLPVVTAKFKPQPISPQWTQLEETVKAALNPVLKGQKSAALAVQEVMPTALAVLSGQ